MKNLVFSLMVATSLASAWSMPAGAVVEDAPVIEGFGTSVPLASAVSQIVPANVRVTYGIGVDIDQPITWRGGKTWRVVLDEIAAQNKLIVTQRRNDLRITAEDPYSNLPARQTATAPAPIPSAQPQGEIIAMGGLMIVPYAAPSEPGQPVKGAVPAVGAHLTKPGLDLVVPHQPAEAPEPAQPAPTQVAEAPAAAPVPAPVATPAPAAEPVPVITAAVEDTTLDPEAPSLAEALRDAVPAETVSAVPIVPVVRQEPWVVHANESLEDAFVRWAKRANWVPVWKARHEYVLEAGASFEGEFVEAVQQLIAAMGSQHPKIVFHKGNTTVVVTDRN